jgi:hypothetical protein
VAGRPGGQGKNGPRAVYVTEEKLCCIGKPDAREEQCNKPQNPPINIKVRREV